MLSVDYQQFDFTNQGLTVHGNRMVQKLRAIAPTGLNFSGKTVLDVGCDHGFWCFFAADEGADSVLGVDRGRNVRGEGFIDLVGRNLETSFLQGYDNVDFDTFEAGKQWFDLGPFNIVLMMSLYHHIYQNTGGDHRSIWYWLARQTNDQVLWENPTDVRDAVVQANVDVDYHSGYTRENILNAALEWFDIDYQGPAEHEPYREVWLLKRKPHDAQKITGKVVSGAGGATKAFLHNNSARIKELKEMLGSEMLPGSMNVVVDAPFNWDSQYFRGMLSDVCERGKGLDVEWVKRPVRLYPVVVAGAQAYALRFEGESYPDNFIELIADHKLRDCIDDKFVEIVRWQ